VPVAAIEDEGTILYSIVTCFFPMPQSVSWLKKTRETAKCYWNQLLIFSVIFAGSSFTPGSSRLSQSLWRPLHSRLQYLQKRQRADTSLVESGPLHGAAYLYDNAVAAIALVGCGEQDKAHRIGAAILWAIDNDRIWHDGRLRNAYAAGVVANGPVKLPGWWDNTQNKWFEDRYQVGSDNGNMAWAMLALLSINDVSTGSRFRDGAARLGTWVAQWADTRGAGGFTGGTFGHEPTPEVRTWKSTEHNTDLAAAFGLLAIRTGDSRWRDMATAAEHFVNAMWDPACACFVAGTAEDGVTRNPIVALDAQVWPLAALPGAAKKFAAAITTAEQRMSVDQGFSYGEDRDGVWTEGTGQMALLMELLGRTGNATSLIAVIESQRSPDGGFYATSVRELPTGFVLDTDPTKPRLYFRLPHLGAASWAALAEWGFNPFTMTKGLP